MITGNEVPTSCALVKFVTLVLAVILVKVTFALVATPVFHTETEPVLNVPPAASAKLFVVFSEAARVPELRFEKAVASCAAVAPFAPARKVSPSIVNI